MIPSIHRRPVPIGCAEPPGSDRCCASGPGSARPDIAGATPGTALATRSGPGFAPLPRNPPRRARRRRGPPPAQRPSGEMRLVGVLTAEKGGSRILLAPRPRLARSGNGGMTPFIEWPDPPDALKGTRQPPFSAANGVRSG